MSLDLYQNTMDAKDYKLLGQDYKILGDSVEYMSRMNDNCVDFIVADPPYGEFPLINDSIREARRVNKGVTLYFMHAEDLLHLNDKPDRVYFWIKPPSPKPFRNGYRRFVEVIAVYDVARHPYTEGLHWTTYTGTYTDIPIETGHPYVKPESLIEKLMRLHSDCSGIVLDPFAGSFTVEKVARKVGFDYTISIEKERKWFDVPDNRS